jgi:hypothetical protein
MLWPAALGAALRYSYTSGQEDNMQSAHQAGPRLLLLGLLLVPATALAGDSLTLLKGVMGVGGSLDATVAVGDQTVDVEGDLAPSFGFAIQSEGSHSSPLAFGGLLQCMFWQEKDDLEKLDYGRNIMIDIDLLVRLAIPVIPDTFYGYGIAAGGLSLNFLDGDLKDDLEPIDVSFGYGFNALVAAGGRIMFSPKFGLFAEVGWQYHKLWHNLELGSAEGTFKPSFGEAVASAGLVLGL